MQFSATSTCAARTGDGKRYRPEVLEITIERGGRQLNVADLLELTVSEAAQLFSGDRDVIRG